MQRIRFGGAATTIIMVGRLLTPRSMTLVLLCVLETPRFATDDAHWTGRAPGFYFFIYTRFFAPIFYFFIYEITLPLETLGRRALAPAGSAPFLAFRAPLVTGFRARESRRPAWRR